jgi:predicted amidohydrolase YtcJ
MIYEIIEKETGKTISTHATYEEAFAAYEKLGWAMVDHAIGETPCTQS